MVSVPAAQRDGNVRATAHRSPVPARPPGLRRRSPQPRRTAVTRAGCHGDLTTLRDRRKSAEQTLQVPTGPSMTALRLVREIRVWIHHLQMPEDLGRTSSHANEDGRLECADS
jgi:hypothetical protein